MKKVLKFGGTSVAGATQINQVVEIVSSYERPPIVVVSAMGGVTNMLNEMASAALLNQHDDFIEMIRKRHMIVIQELLSNESRTGATDYCQEMIDELAVICKGIYMLQELSDRSKARLMSFGELMSSFIIAERLKQDFPNAARFDARKIIITDDNLLKAKVDIGLTERNINDVLNNFESVAVIPGFISGTKNGMTSTLGRGGSDYTAALFASAILAPELHIYSDVSGMLSANPRVVSEAMNIEQMSYNEAFELSHFGAKVLYPPAIQPAYEKKIPLVLKNTFDPQHLGTTINDQVDTEKGIVTGISSIDNVAMVNLTGIAMVGVSGYSSRVFSALHRGRINVIMIAQSCSERGICVAIAKEDLVKSQHVLKQEFEEEIKLGRVDPIKPEDNLSIIALVGDGMKYRSGVSGLIFSTLGHYGINIRAIAQGSSESNISIILDSTDEMRALQKLHTKFFEAKPAPVHLFVLGIGNVGRQFLSLIQKQSELIAKNQNYNIQICGISNSKKMILDASGITIDKYENALDESTVAADLESFYDFIVNFNAPNKVIIDNTASAQTANLYLKALKNGVHVVTCNKIVASSSTEVYDGITGLARRGPARFHYETNVGAALPMLQTVESMRKSGDRIHRMQAVLSGSLNYIFDLYDASSSFAEVVRQAREEGYTEPNPMDDLGGVDVARKIVILAREAGYQLEMNDVELAKDMPAACYETNNTDEVFDILDQHETYFSDKVRNASENGQKLKYIAEFNNGKCKVGLQLIDKDHVFYAVRGTDNVLAIYSDRYSERPLIIQGAGAGAEQTAAGVLSDILRIDFES